MTSAVSSQSTFPRARMAKDGGTRKVIAAPSRSLCGQVLGWNEMAEILGIARGVRAQDLSGDARRLKR
ncbi:MAG: hypothetical protein JNL28_08225 [Planctomycetes bacterium]|nr:hypothetical protein [Planctomycetota bacterium]